MNLVLVGSAVGVGVPKHVEVLAAGVDDSSSDSAFGGDPVAGVEGVHTSKHKGAESSSPNVSHMRKRRMPAAGNAALWQLLQMAEVTA